MKLSARIFAASMTLALLTPSISSSQASKEKPPAQPAQTITATGCVEAGVEAGCRVLKDSKTLTLYNLFFKGKAPAINTAIRFTGTAHEGPTTCMQGKAVDVKKFTVLRMHCPAPKK